MDSGLAPRELSRMFALIAVLFTALITAGGFAFVGATEPVYQTVHVRNKVVPATRGNYIDFRNHVSPDKRVVSATFLLLILPVCIDGGFTNSTWYSRINEFHNLRDIKWPRTFRIFNITCVFEANGFVKETILTTQDGFPLYGTDDCLHLLKLETFKQLQLPSSITPAIHGTCPYQDVELRCSNHSIVQCVGSARVQDDFGGFILFHSIIRQTQIEISTHHGRTLERDDLHVLESMVFVASIYPETDLYSLRNCAASRVEESASVQQLVGERNVTQVNIGLIISTFGPSIALLILLAAVASVMWVRVVWFKGRRWYNSFSSNEDSLACVAQALKWHTNGGAERTEMGMVVRGVHVMYVACKVW
ncbi:hypothetical protein FGB62_190g013 [Gracilaria domingensis]|nr:hypothetical protein FGB62_190g013 [Gracilaria domingensis]